MPENRPPNDADPFTAPEQMLAALDWYRAAGIDLAVGEAPVDRFAATLRAKAQRAAAPAAARELPQIPTAPAASTPITALFADPSEARALAAAAPDLEALRTAFDAYDGCGLKLRATQLVFSDGNPQARIMLVGEGPGQEEDLRGKPFVGRAGQLLDRMLGAIGLDRTQVYIANVVPWRPPGNRNPTAQEIAACRPFLDRQIELVAPKILVALGAVASQTLFETSTGITRLRGQWRELSVNGHTMQAVATLHPAYLLRTPSAKQHVWRDLLELKRRILSQNILHA